MNTDNFTVDTSKWSMYALERAEYDCCIPLEYEGDITHAILDDYQPVYAIGTSYVEYTEEEYSLDMMTRKELNHLEWIKFINTRQGA